jgi:hypothetical protein
MWTDEVGLPSLLATSSRQGFVESSASGMGGESGCSQGAVRIRVKCTQMVESTSTGGQDSLGQPAEKK